MLGANGAGKTTLMRAALGLVPVAVGRDHAFSAGRPRAAIPRSATCRRTAAQSPAQRLTGWDVVASAAIGRRFGFVRLDKATRREIDWALDQVGARELARRSIGEMSGGERQKVLLSQALLGRPRLLLLDEPLISLDPAHQKSVVEIARRICDDLKVAILFSAHELNPLVNAIDRVLYLGAGAAVIGPVDEVVTGPVLSRLYGTRDRGRARQGPLFRDGGRRRRRARRASPRHDHVARPCARSRRRPCLNTTSCAPPSPPRASRRCWPGRSASSSCCAARPSPAMRCRMSASPARQGRCCSACRRSPASSASRSWPASAWGSSARSSPSATSRSA